MDALTHRRPAIGHVALLKAICALPRNYRLPCRSAPQVWFSSDIGDVLHAMHECSRCPIRTRCLVAAIQAREPHGVWGGVRFPCGATHSDSNIGVFGNE